MEESQYIKAIRDGDTDAYAPLVERYWVGLVIYCEQLVGDRDQAEDIAQRAFIKAYDHISSFDHERSCFSTWLYRIARNTAIDTLRAEKRPLPHDEELVDEASPHDPVADNAKESERNIEIRAAVERLKPAEQRHVIQGYYWEGKSYKMLAEEFGVPINTIKTWLYRAKKQLKEELS